MSDQPEQLGPLRFETNLDYPYPFAVEHPPHFWMEETTGVLAVAVEVYLRAEKLEPAHLEVLKLYLRQYIERAVMADDGGVRSRLLGRIERLRTIGDVGRLVESMNEVGMEPF
ncbi:MAG: hypothetical protein AB4911_05165 [Oscillochloridaceae bacterium umkhey_bin13]